MPAGSQLYNILVSFTAAVGGFCFGWEIGVIGQVLGMPDFIQTFNAGDTATQSWIASVFQFGCAASAFAFGYLADTIGRKRSIMFAGLAFAIGGAMQAGSSQLGVLITGRVISGFAIGAASTTAEFRGSVTVIYQLMITAGILIAGSINAGIIGSDLQNNSTGWRLALGLQIIPALLLLALMFSGRNDEALDTIAKLRALPQGTRRGERRDFRLEQSVGDAGWGEVFKGSNGRRVFIGVMNQAMQQLTGINVITYFQPQLQVLPVVFDFANFIFTFIGMFTIDRFGRKFLLTWGGVCMTLGLALTYGFGKATQVGAGSALAYISYVGIIVFDLGFSSTWGPVVWSYQAEIFPMRIRSKGVALSTMSNWLVGAIITWAEPYLSRDLGVNVYIIYLCFCALSVPWTVFFVPETRGKTLEELGEVFGDKVAHLDHQSEGDLAAKAKS
ncbi:general substrate transporter [Zopfochytrium polystomum]|nr:general substrate transporter [Zopfochytrium polystomum]